MQSDNPNDLGWADMTRQKDKMNVIVPSGLNAAVASPNLTGRDNIAAGVGYLLFRAAIWGPKTVIDKKDVKTVTVARGDSHYAIARRVGTTEHVLREMNPHAPLFPLKIGTNLKYSPARTITTITGWRKIDPQSTYQLYNHHPGTDYAHKVQFLYDLIKDNKILD